MRARLAGWRATSLAWTLKMAPSSAAMAVGDVDALPPEMAGVEVDAEGGMRGGAELEQGFGVVDAEAGVGFERDAGRRSRRRRRRRPASTG